MQEIFERLLYLIKILENNNQSQFARKVGCPQTTLNGYLNKNGQEKIRFSLLKRLLKAYPNVSREWLYDGEGEPFVEENAREDKSALTKRVEALENELTQMQTRLFIESPSDQGAQTNTGNVAGQE